MTVKSSGLRVGLYIDGENIARQGGRNMRFGALCEFARRGGAEAIRLNAYVACDHERADHDAGYREGKRSYHNALRDHGFKVIEKAVKWYASDDGEWVSKANADLDLAVDVLMQSERLDRVLLVSGDGDFARVVSAVQGRGCRVEVVAFDNVSKDLRHECDQFVSGYLIPGLLPAGGGPAWGEPGSRVRGTCCTFTDKNYGFLRFFAGPGADGVDQREVFFRRGDGPDDFDYDRLPSRDYVFEFTIAEDKGDRQAAKNVKLVTSYNKTLAARRTGSPRRPKCAVRAATSRPSQAAPVVLKETFDPRQPASARQTSGEQRVGAVTRTAESDPAAILGPTDSRLRPGTTCNLPSRSCPNYEADP